MERDEGMRDEVFCPRDTSLEREGTHKKPRIGQGFGIEGLKFAVGLFHETFHLCRRRHGSLGHRGGGRGFFLRSRFFLRFLNILPTRLIVAIGRHERGRRGRLWDRGRRVAAMVLLQFVILFHKMIPSK